MELVPSLVLPRVAGQIDINLDSVPGEIIARERISYFKAVLDRLGFHNPTNKPIKFVFFDIETYIKLTPDQIDQLKKVRWETAAELKEVLFESEVIPWGLAWNIADEEKIHYSAFHLDKHAGFISAMIELGKKYFVALIAHNAVYEIQVLANLFADNGISLFAKFTGTDVSRVLSTAMENKLDGCILDTFNFYRTSLENAAGIRKREVPYGLVNLQIDEKKDLMRFFQMDSLKNESHPYSVYVQYLREDIELLKIVWQKFITTIKTVLRLCGEDPESWLEHVHRSSSSLAAFYQRTIMKKNQVNYFDKYRFQVSKLEIEVQNRCCFGAWVGYNKNSMKCKGTRKIPIRAFDFKSMYPSIMIEGIPGGTFMSSPPWRGEYLTWIMVERTEVDLITAPEYSFCSTGLMPEDIKAGEYILLCEELYKDCLEFYSNFKEAYRFFNKRYQFLFRDFESVMVPLFELKEKIALKMKNGTATIEDYSDYASIKVLLNSNYGKLAEKTRFAGTYLIEKDYHKELKEMDEMKILNRASGFYVPQMGRSKLFRAMKERLAKKDLVLYWDTDSLIVKSIYEPAKKTSRMGDLDHKGDFSEIYVIAKKKYVLEPFTTPKREEDSQMLSAAFGGIATLPELLPYLWKHDRANYKKLKSLLLGVDHIRFRNNTVQKTHNRKRQPVLYSWFTGLKLSPKGSAIVELLLTPTSFNVYRSSRNLT